MLFLVIGAVSAVDSSDVVNKEDSNLMGDNDISLSAENKLEISSEYSISETNIVYSHDDNLGNNPDDEVLAISADSYGDNNESLASNADGAAETDSVSSPVSSTDGVATGVSSSNVVGAEGATELSAGSATLVTTKLSVENAHYGKSATIFKVTLKDKNGKALSNQKVSLKVNKVSYSAFTNSEGIALIKTASLRVGTYDVSISYGGNSNYASSSLSKKVKVLSSVAGSDLTKYTGYSCKYVVKFWKDNSVLANTKVTFKFNGKTYTKTTNANGEASLSIGVLVGKYGISTKNPYSGEKASYKIVVKKAKTQLIVKDKTYIPTNKKSKFSVVLKTEQGVLLHNRSVSFTYNNKTVTAKTNEDGKATITIPVLARGTYNVVVKYKGSENLHASSDNAKIIVAKPTTKLTSSAVVMNFNDGSKFKVKLTDSEGNPLANKSVKIVLNGKTSILNTNSKGKATLGLKNLLPGNYLAKYSHSSYGMKDYSSGSKRVIVLYNVAKVSAKDLTMKLNDESSYKVVVKDESGKLLNGVFVESIINGKSYIYQTDSKGIAKLKITQGVGCYSIKTLLADPIYKSAPVTKQLIVKGSKFVPVSSYVPIGHKAVYSVKLVNEKDNPLKNKKVVFTFNGKNLTATTNDDGVAKINLDILSKGTHNINFQYGKVTGSAKIYVISKVPIKDIIKASKSVKSFISKNAKLPSTVKIGDVSFKTADYLYLASKAIVNLKAGNKKDISLKILDNPKKPQDATNLGYLRNYVGVAKSVVKTAETKGILPDYVTTSAGQMGYKGVVSTLSNVLVYYGNHNEKLPTYILVKSFTGVSSPINGALNFKNKISDLAPYLAATKNCEINDAQIKQLVSKLTKNCKTDKEKANVIYNYVRDKISYSFYYNTRYGAAGTLKAKHGNCVDQAHLVVAMCRCAGLPAMYSHGTCHFSSGNTYGHVWGMVLIGDTWTVVDPVSTRNSLGKVVNWNTNSFVFKGYHQSISF